MDRRLVIGVLVIGVLAILIKFRKPNSLPEQISSGEFLLDEGESLEFDSPITEELSSIDAIRPYDFYKISARWPKSVCGSTPGCLTPPYFTLHGLWPHYNPDEQVPPYAADPNCTNVEPSPDTSITRESLKDILKNMDDYWPSLANPSPTDNLVFWRYEWNEHGKCWDKPKLPIAYFRQALNFLLQNNLTIFLKKGGIVPDNTQTHHWTMYAKAIKDKLKKDPEINCDNSNQLREIRVCYDHKSRIDCPTKFTGPCTSPDLIFPVP